MPAVLEMVGLSVAVGVGVGVGALGDVAGVEPVGSGVSGPSGADESGGPLVGSAGGVSVGVGVGVCVGGGVAAGVLGATGAAVESAGVGADGVGTGRMLRILGVFDAVVDDVAGAAALVPAAPLGDASAAGTAPDTSVGKSAGRG